MVKVFNANIHGILFFHIGNITKVILNQLFAYTFRIRANFFVMKLKFQIFFYWRHIRISIFSFFTNFFLLKAHLNFAHPFMSSLSGFGTKAVITFSSLKLEKTLVFSFLRCSRSSIVSLGDSSYFYQIYLSLTLKIFSCIIIS